MPELVILDFDGVVADSEVVANQVLVGQLAELGFELALHEAAARYTGTRLSDVVADIEADTGVTLPPGFVGDFDARCRVAMREGLRPVPGLAGFLDGLAAVRMCIASSSSPDYLRDKLAVLGLTERFGSNVFSAAMVERGKPHPDIFLHAAREMGVAPAQAVVVEDSVAGVRAGVASGATVIGLLAGSHVPHGHGERLAEAGAHHVADSFLDAAAIVEARRSRRSG